MTDQSPIGEQPPATPSPTEAVTPAAAPDQRPTRMLGLSLGISGVFTIVIAVILGATIDPLLYLIALVAVIDFLFAWLFASGRIGPAARERREAESTGDAASVAQEDPGYNPYARED